MEKTIIAPNKKSVIIAQVAALAASAGLVGKEDQHFILVDELTERALAREVCDGLHSDLAKKMRSEGKMRQYFQRISGFRTLWGNYNGLGFRAAEPKNSIIAQVRGKMHESKLSASQAVVRLDKATEMKMFEELRSGMYGDDVRTKARVADKLADVIGWTVSWNVQFDADKFEVAPRA